MTKEGLRVKQKLFEARAAVSGIAELSKLLKGMEGRLIVLILTSSEAEESSSFWAIGSKEGKFVGFARVKQGVVSSSSCLLEFREYFEFEINFSLVML